MLKLKSIIYRYTGIYLAKKEEQECLKSYLAFIKFKKVDQIEHYESIIIGSWQAENGFTRPFTTLKWKGYRKWYNLLFRFLDWCLRLVIVIKWDLTNLIKNTHSLKKG